jgi:Xaa-Pro aminopeptidase
MTKPTQKTGKATGWADHLLARQNSLRQRIAGRSLGGLLITNAPDIRYLTGFVGDDSWLVLTEDQVHLLSDFRFQEQIAAVAPRAKTIMRKGRMTDALVELLADLSVDVLGYQAEHVSSATLNKLTESLESVTLSSTEDWLTDQRAVKDRQELRAIKRAIAIAEQAYELLLGQIREGMTEYEVVALLEYNMRWLGGEGPSFETIVAIGPHGSLPHYRPGRGRVRVGYPILIDFGTRSEGYCSDLTRVVSSVRFKPKIAEIYPIVAQAQQAAIDAIRPGRTCREIDAAARKVIEKAGYGDQFGHGLGHGIGLDIHEKPTVGPRSPQDAQLQAGHVVTVEPGIYLPGIGGVRIEDDVLVTDRGAKVLSSLNKDLESAII